MKTVKEIIEEFGNTQTEFARRINVAQPQVSRWVRDSVAPPSRYLTAICREFKISADWILETDDDTPMFLSEKRNFRREVGTEALRSLIKLRNVIDVAIRKTREIKG